MYRTQAPTLSGYIACIALGLFTMLLAALVFAAPAHAQTCTNGTGVLQLGYDVVAAGERVAFESSDKAQGNLFAAGKELSVEGSLVGIDALLAGQTVSVKGAKVGNNLYAAGNEVTADASVAGYTGVAGTNVKLAGAQQNVVAYGDSVSLTGSYQSVEVHAATLNVGSNTQIEGKLVVYAPSEPSIPDGARIGSVEFHMEKADTGLLSTGLAASAGALVLDALFTLLGSLVLGLLMLLLLGAGPFARAAANFRRRPVRALLAGLVTCIAVPLAVLVLAVLIVGLRSALVLVLAAFVLGLVCLPYAAIGVGRMLFPRMNKWGASVLMLLVFGILACIPFVGALVHLFATLFTVGCVVTGIIDRRKEDTAADKGAGTGAGGSEAQTQTPSAVGGQTNPPSAAAAMRGTFQQPQQQVPVPPSDRMTAVAASQAAADASQSQQAAGQSQTVASPTDAGTPAGTAPAAGDAAGQAAQASMPRTDPNARASVPLPQGQPAEQADSTQENPPSGRGALRKDEPQAQRQTQAQTAQQQTSAQEAQQPQQAQAQQQARHEREQQQAQAQQPVPTSPGKEEGPQAQADRQTEQAQAQAQAQPVQAQPEQRGQEASAAAAATEPKAGSSRNEQIQAILRKLQESRQDK